MRSPLSRKRVLYVIDFATSTGGAERFAVGLAAHLPRSRFEPWLCATRAADPVAAAALAEAGVPLVTLGRRAKWDVHRLFGLAALLRRQRFDILHTHKFGSNFWGSQIGWACRVPVIVAHEHSWSYEGNPPRAWADGRLISRLATRFVAVSSADARRMVSVEGVDPDKIVMIPNGYVPSPVRTSGDVRAELGLTRDTPVVAIAALLRPEKRLDLLLTAHAKLRATVPDAHLLIAGDGECRQSLEHQAAQLGLNGSVRFLGTRTDVDSVLRAADVGVLSSEREGSPLLVFECMANQTPLVATAVGGVPDVVEDGRTGMLVPRHDPDALAEALAELLRDPRRRAAMAAAAAAALADHSIDAVAERFAELYEGLV